MRQLENIFRPLAKKFLDDTNHGSYIEIGFNCDSDKTGYQIKLGCFDIIVSELCTGEDFEETAEKLYKRLTTMVEERLRENPFIVSARPIDFDEVELVRPNTDFTPVMANEPVEVSQCMPMSFDDFCEELEEV